jgi:hypothetical protein
MNLESADLRAADLREVNFFGSNLRYADLRGASVQGANFQRATLYGAKLQGVEAYRADFRNCDLRLANFGGAYTDGAVIPPAEWRQPSPGEIADGLGTDEKPWDERLEEERKGTQDSNAGNGQGDQNEQARGRSLPHEQREKGRRR